MVFLTGPTQKSSKYGSGLPQQEKMTKYTGPTQDLLTQKSSKYGTGTPQQDKNSVIFCVLRGTSVLSHFFLLGSTSSILRTFLGQEVLGGTSVLFSCWGGTSSILGTFLGGTSQKKHPVEC